MNKKEKLQLEEDYDEQIKQIDQTEVSLDDSKDQLYIRTNQLIDQVDSFYRSLPGEHRSFDDRLFEENLREFNSMINYQRDLLEEDRIKIKKEFNRKLDE